MADQKAPNNPNIVKIVRFADFVIFGLLLGLLCLIIFFSAKANIQSDSIDYYSILQRLTDSSKHPIVDNLHFVEQRSPGYSIISTLPYYITSFAIEPFVKTEEIVGARGQMPPGPPPGGNERPRPDSSVSVQGSEEMSVPPEPLLARDVFFKNFYLERAGAWFEWKIILSLLLTSYVLLFLGIVFSLKTLALRNKTMIGASLPMLVIFTSTILLHNVVDTPAYATLAAFGLSSIFCFFFVKSFEETGFRSQLLAGLFLGFLVLIRLETALIAGSLCIFLIVSKKWRFLKYLVLGGSLPLAILLVYNYSQFGTLFHSGILRGDINQLGLDPSYIYANLFNPKSGILFFSFFTFLGLIGVFLGDRKPLKALGIASLVLIALLLVRVPIMYKNMGGGTLNIGGILVTSPRTMEEALMLVRSDANRYVTVLSPFAILGLQNLIYYFWRLFRKEKHARDPIVVATGGR